MKRNKIGMITIILVSVLVGFFIGVITPTLTVKGIAKEENLEEFAAPEDVCIFTEYEPGSVDFYRQLVENLELVEIYDSSELTYEMLQERDGKIIIEECIGMVTDKTTGAGKVLNTSEGYYINYSQVDGINDGTIILTYFIYNPDTNYEDDILYRFDYIIDREFED